MDSIPLFPVRGQPCRPMTRRAALQRGSALLAAAACVCAPAARAGDYPGKPVTIVVNFPPGAGAPDLSGARGRRRCCQGPGPSPSWSTTKAGAGGNIGAQHVAGATADGHTLLATVDTTLTVNPSIYPTMPFDADRAFLPIATLGTFSQMLVVNTRTLPVKTFGEFVARAKSQPVHYASAGNGSPGHIASELPGHDGRPAPGARALPRQCTRGPGPAGRRRAAGLSRHLRCAAARAVGQADGAGCLQRAPLARHAPMCPPLPNRATPASPSSSDWVLAAPAGTPPQVARIWQEQVRKTLARDEIRQRLLEWDVHPSGAGSEDTARRLARERTRWAEVTRRAGIRADG